MQCSLVGTWARTAWTLPLLFASLPTLHAADSLVTKELPGVDKIRLLPPTENNPRNSEGDFIELRDGRVLFVYSHFTGGGSDHAAAHLAGRFSSDGGKTWSEEDVPIVENEGGMNVMSVSLLRLDNGDIALFYLVKNSLTDCRPAMRISSDEAKTWSEPKMCIAEPGYNVMNNDRAVQLQSGRIVLPVALHPNDPQTKSFDPKGIVRCHYSDDSGKTWQPGEVAPAPSADGKGLTLQEPGLVQLEDGRCMMFCRTPHGSQYLSYSSDEGKTWTAFEPSEIHSPVSPATIERIPSTGDLLLVWNNHANVTPEIRGRRTPYNAAISRDEGRTWENVKTLEDDPHGWYCYTAMAFVDDHVLLGHCAGDRRTGGLNTTQITRIPVQWLYE
ncbi:sialidase family protein [Candidatus Laterigemmans baculatus]|uniref:sialidase family protein n=1 Tax=Candidatus Laterigemmans baculatus TaxID=2770505 RepID=UPI0013DB53EC|nr:sialidase family protein [Candidatus Laterigemmans baculatus]